MSVDLSNKDYLVPIATVDNMKTRAEAYSKKNPKEKDFKVFTNIKTKTEYIMYSKLKDMIARAVQWKKDNPNKKLEQVWINKPKTIATVKAVEDWKKDPIIKTVMAKVGDWDTVKDLVEKIRAYAKSKGGMYNYYLNSRFIGINKEISAFTDGKMGNCVDWSQFLKGMIKIMNKAKQYIVELIQWQCTNVTHITNRVTGMEFKKPTVIDLAAIVDANSRRYEIGEHWCFNKIVAINPGWLNE